MKIRNDASLSRLATKLSIYVGIDDLLEKHKISCIAQCNNEFYGGDEMKMFKFGHENWSKNIVAFWDDDFSYYAVGSVKEIQKILRQELQEIDEDDNNE